MEGIAADMRRTLANVSKIPPGLLIVCDAAASQRERARDPLNRV